MQGVPARYFLHLFPSFRPPVVESYRSPICGPSNIANANCGCNREIVNRPPFLQASPPIPLYPHPQMVQSQAVLGCLGRGLPGGGGGWGCQRGLSQPTLPSGGQSRLRANHLDSIINGGLMGHQGPNMTTTMFEFISRCPIFRFCGTPGRGIKCPLHTAEHREITKIFICQLPIGCSVSSTST